MKFFRTVILLLVVCLLSVPLNGQVLNIRNFGAREGLIQSQVNSITQDDQNRLWFGTYNGISIFDGKRFTTLTKKDGLASNSVYFGIKDHRGDMWFGHTNGTLSHVHEPAGNIEKIFLSADNRDSISVTVTCLYEDKNNRLWVATDRWGVYYFEKDSLKQNKFLRTLGKGRVYAIAEDDKGSLWLGSDRMIYRYRPASQTLDSLNLEPGAGNVYYQSLLNDGQGSMWIGLYSNGLLQYRFADSAVTSYSTKNGLASDNVVSLYTDNNNRLWAANPDAGVSYTDLNKVRSFQKLDSKNGLPYDGVNTVLQDSEGSIWFGTSGHGAAQLKDGRFEIWRPGNTMDENNIWSMYIDPRSGHHWFGSSDGLFIVDAKGKLLKKIETYKTYQLGDVSLLREGGKKVWLISAQNGLMSVNKRNYRITPFDLPDSLSGHVINSFQIDDAGNYWIGGLGIGLLKYRPNTRKFTHVLVPDKKFTKNSVNQIYKDSKNIIWIGMKNGGLYRIEDGNLVKVPGAPKTIVGIAEGTFSDYWVIDDQDQLFRYAHNTFTDFTINRGLEGHSIYSVLADSEGVWVGTTVGLAHLTCTDSLFTFFGMREGFMISECNENAVYKSPHGQLWFGTIEGAVTYYPDKQRYNYQPPITTIRGVRQFFKSKPLPENNVFGYRDNHLTFDFIGVSLTVPERVRYKYRLAGFEELWSPETDLTSVTYSNLAPGTYTFEVIAANNDGVWNSKPATFTFTIGTPFWQTWWFGLMILAVAVGLVYGYIYWRVNTIKRINILLGQKVEERTADLLKEKESVEQTLAALQESETKFRTYTELTTSGIFIYQDDKFKYANKACMDISQYSETELMEKSIWDLVHPDFHAELRQRLARRMKGKEVLSHYEFKGVRKDGSVGWMDYSGLMINYNNRPALLATLVDITERKVAERELMAEKERLAVTLRSIGDGVITTDMQGQVTLINEQARKILTISSDTQSPLLLDDILVVFDEVSGERLPSPIEKLRSQTDLSLNEKDCVIQQPDGRQKYITLAVSPLRNETSELIGTVLVVRDVTKRRQMEHELFKNQKLESVGVLAGGIAHDFNNILTAIIGNLSLAKLTLDPDDEVAKRIEKAELASARAQDLTQQLLTFSKGGAPVKKVSAIDDIVRESVSFILSGSNVKCTIDIDKNLPALEVDAGQISQVIQNLVLNADQAMPEGGEIKIHMRTITFKMNHKGISPGQYLRIDIADEGVGIPKQYLDKIFDPFFTTKQSGSGLGLATSYSIIKKHHGRLIVKSTPGQGTVFSVYLPIPSETQIPDEVQFSDISDFKTGGRILVMDDEEYIHETVGQMLGSIGYEVISVNDGKEALQQYGQARKEGKPFDMVIMDLTIPGGMGGKAAVDELIKMDPKARVIVSSGYSSDPVMANYSEFGFAGCLKKPYRIDDLVHCLKEVS